MKLQDTLSKIFKRRSTGNLKHIAESVDKVIERVADDLKLLELEYSITSATGEWLDEWGTWFGITRESKESDEDVRERILAVIYTLKVTIPALTATIKDLLKNPDLGMEIFEPHLQIMVHNESKFSGTHRIQDGLYWRGAVIDILLKESVTQDIIDVVYRIKPAGTKVYFTYTLDLFGEDGVLIGYTDVEPIYWFEKISDILAKLPNRGLTPSESSYDNMVSGNKYLWNESSRVTKIPVIWDSVDNFRPIAKEVVSLFPATISSLMSDDRLTAISGYWLDRYDLENPLPFEDNGLTLPPGVFVPHQETSVHYEDTKTSNMIVLSYGNNGATISAPSNDNSLSGRRSLYKDHHRSSDLNMVYSHPKYLTALNVYLRDIAEYELDGLLDISMSSEEDYALSGLPKQTQMLVEVVTVDV